MVLFTGAELFTGNCLITIPVLERRLAWTGMLRNLCWVYIGNLIGAVLLAAAIVYSGQLNLSDGALAVHHPDRGGEVFPFLWQSGGPGDPVQRFGLHWRDVRPVREGRGRTRSGRLPASLLFVICGFEHCVANMYYIPAGLLALEVPAMRSWRGRSALR